MSGSEIRLTTSADSSLRFWINTVRTMTEIAQALKSGGIISDFVCDPDRDYTYCSSVLVGGQDELRISRWVNNPECSVDFTVIPKDPSVDSNTIVRVLAPRIRMALNVTVYVGTIQDSIQNGRETRGYWAAETLPRIT
jgi:hypothetical protein